jgi:hypothetical protein
MCAEISDQNRINLELVRHNVRRGYLVFSAPIGYNIVSDCDDINSFIEIVERMFPSIFSFTTVKSWANMGLDSYRTKTGKDNAVFVCLRETYEQYESVINKPTISDTEMGMLLGYGHHGLLGLETDHYGYDMKCYIGKRKMGLFEFVSPHKIADNYIDLFNAFADVYNNKTEVIQETIFVNNKRKCHAQMKIVQVVPADSKIRFCLKEEFVSREFFRNYLANK